MKKSKILEISKLSKTDLHSSKDVDIDTLIHKAIYNISQSGFNHQLDNREKSARYFIDIVYPAIILKVCDNLSEFPGWKSAKEKLSKQEKYISSTYQSIQQFKNFNISENPFYQKNKDEINNKIEDFCNKYESLYFDVNQRLIAYHAIMNENSFRKQFMCHQDFPEVKRTLNFRKLMSNNTIDRMDWERESLIELTDNLSTQDGNQTIIKSFANFCSKVKFEPDAPVYGTSFVTDFMPEIIARLTSHNSSDWNDEVNNLNDHSTKQQKMIGDANKIISEIIRFESTWNKESDLLDQFSLFKEKFNSNKSTTALGFSL